MKNLTTFILISAITQVILTTEPSCPAANWCQSCNGSSCTECYSWGNGKYADKAFSSNGGTTCDGTMPTGYKVENCLHNWGTNTIMYTGAGVSTTTHPRCLKCDTTF